MGCRQGKFRQYCLYCFVFEGTMASFLPISTLQWATLWPRIGPSSSQHDKLHSGSLRTCPHLSPSSSSRRGAVCGAAWCSGHWPRELTKCTSIETLYCINLLIGPSTLMVGDRNMAKSICPDT